MVPIVVAVLVAVAVLWVLFGFRGNKSIARQIAAMPGNSRPSQELASVDAPPGQAVELSAVAHPGQLALWLEYAITTDRSRRWAGEVALTFDAPAAEAQRFAIEYDGEDHRSGPAVHGLVYFPSPGADPPATERGTLKLATLPSLSPGAPVRLRVSIHPTGPWAASSLRLFLGVSPT